MVKMEDAWVVLVYIGKACHDGKLTVEMMVTTRLPHLEKMAKKPMTNSAAVKMVAMMKAQFIHPATFL
jgi:hypothetical protein